MATKKPAKSKRGSREAFGKDAERIIGSYVREKNPELKDIAEKLRRTVKKAMPQSREVVNPWGIPTFDFHGPCCFMMIGKNHITFGFARGALLADPDELLEGTGKNLRHIKVREIEQLRSPNLRQLIREAAAMNLKTPLTSSMRVKR